MKHYFALTADMQKSRSLATKQRWLVQQRMEASLAYLNVLHAPGILVDVAFSAGDEVQGLFSSMGAAFLFYRGLSLLMAPFVRFRGGIGVGGWGLRMDGRPTTEQDGTAYHRARSAVERAKKSKTYSLAIDGDAPLERQTVLAGYSLGIIGGRGSKQAQTACLVELCRPLVLEGEAERLQRLSGLAYELWQQGNFAHEGKERGLICDQMDFPLDCMEEVPLAFSSGIDVSYLEASLRGISYRFADLGYLGTRTSIGRVMRSGEVYQERAAAALMVLDGEKGCAR